MPLTAFSQQIFTAPILIVEDNEINRIFIEKALQSRGFYNFLSVASAEAAIGKIGQFNPELVLLDIVMPGMDGFQFCEAIRRHANYKELPILVQTTLSEPAMRVKAFEMGATDFVSKPIYPDELCARVMVHLEKRLSLKMLQLYKNRIKAELESARQLQQTILPGADDIEEARHRCSLDMASYFQPSSEIGGDFWGMKILFPHQTALWMVDFSGHGVAAALNTFRLHAYLQEHALAAARPGEYLSHLNDKLLQLLPPGQFATMFYGIIDTQGNQLLYTCACSPHPILLRRATGKAEMIDGSGVPLGVGMHLYQTKMIPFALGDTLLLYSDALIETPNATGTFITEEHIMHLMERHAGAPSGVIKQKLLDYFKKHAGTTLRDDLTIAVCTRSAV